MSKKLSWRKWRRAVIRQMEHIGYEDPETDFDDDAWRGYYDDDYTPEEAVYENESYG